MKIGGYQILDVYNYTFTVGTGVKVDGSYKLIKAMRGKPINTSRIKIGAVTYDAAYLAFIPDGTSFKATFGDKTITIAADDTITFTNGIIGGGGGGGTQVQADWTEDDPTEPSYIQNKPALSEVATSGDYDDLENKPSIPAPQVQADWNEADTEDPSYIQNKPTIPIGIPVGGTSGQVLSKASDNNYDVEWTGGVINEVSNIVVSINENLTTDSSTITYDKLSITQTNYENMTPGYCYGLISLQFNDKTISFYGYYKCAELTGGVKRITLPRSMFNYIGSSTLGTYYCYGSIAFGDDLIARNAGPVYTTLIKTSNV